MKFNLGQIKYCILAIHRFNPLSILGLVGTCESNVHQACLVIKRGINSRYSFYGGNCMPYNNCQ